MLFMVTHKILKSTREPKIPPCQCIRESMEVHALSPLMVLDKGLIPGAECLVQIPGCCWQWKPRLTDLQPPSQGDATSALASPPSRALHLTRSVYIRHIPAKISTENIVEVCFCGGGGGGGGGGEVACLCV